MKTSLDNDFEKGEENDAANEMMRELRRDDEAEDDMEVQDGNGRGRGGTVMTVEGGETTVKTTMMTAVAAGGGHHNKRGGGADNARQASGGKNNKRVGVYKVAWGSNGGGDVGGDSGGGSWLQFGGRWRCQMKRIRRDGFLFGTSSKRTQLHTH